MSLVSYLIWLTLTKQTATSEGTTRKRRLSRYRYSLWLEDLGAEGVLGVEDALLVLIVGVLVAHAAIFVIRVVLAPVELILMILSITVE